MVAYLDFDLRIEHAGDAYLSRVLDSPAGEATATFSVPFSPVEIENLILKVSHSIGRRDVRRIESPEVQGVMAFGARLFEAVFAGDVRACLRSSISEASHQEAGLRIRLRLGDVPELIDLPWEYLYNPTLDRFIARQLETPIVRYLDLPEPIRPLAIQPPVRVLVMISSPSDYPPLDVDREFERLGEALSGLRSDGLVTLERLDDATLTALRHRLRRGEHQVFHFIGHGGFDEAQDDGVLVIEDDAGRGHKLSGRSLGEMLRGLQPVRLAILNACEGARNGTTDPFAGAAQSMVQQGIAAVIAMQFEITDTAAIVFAQEFYAAIADGYPVDAALGEARRAIFSQGNELEWATPVLYMRAADGRIFDIDKSTPPPPVEPGEQEPPGGVDVRRGVTVTLEPEAVAVDPGHRASARLTVRNTGEARDLFHVSLTGWVPAWASLETTSLDLDAGEEGSAGVDFAPPAALGAGTGPIGIAVEVRSSADPAISETRRGSVEVPAPGWFRRHRRSIALVGAIGLLLLGAALFLWSSRDRTGPAIVVSGPELSRDTATIQLGATEAATFLCRLDDQPRASCSSPLVLSDLADGPHVLTAWAVDEAGNEGEAGMWRWTVDTAPPTVKLRVVETGADSATIRITVDDPEATVTCTLNGESQDCDPTRATLTDLSGGLQIFRVRATDLAGNESETTNVKWTPGPTPGPALGVPSNDSIPTFTCDSDFCTASPGGWTGEPTSYTYAWQENCDQDLSGNGCTDAQVTGEQVPRLCGYARVRVTARNAAGESDPVYSEVGPSNLMC